MFHVISHMSLFFISTVKVVELAGGGSVINGAYPVTKYKVGFYLLM